MADDGEQIDEGLGPQKVVDFVLARGVTAHEALHGGRFVRREMVDVQVGVGFEALCHEVDEALECGPFFPPVRSPVADVRRLPFVIEEGVAEQEFQAAFPNERITLEIEEDVALRRRGKP